MLELKPEVQVGNKSSMCVKCLWGTFSEIVHMKCLAKYQAQEYLVNFSLLSNQTSPI